VYLEIEVASGLPRLENLPLGEKEGFEPLRRGTGRS
jgi:hypothetical protein